MKSTNMWIWIHECKIWERKHDILICFRYSTSSFKDFLANYESLYPTKSLPGRHSRKLIHKISPFFNLAKPNETFSPWSVILLSLNMPCCPNECYSLNRYMIYVINDKTFRKYLHWWTNLHQASCIFWQFSFKEECGINILSNVLK